MMHTSDTVDNAAATPDLPLDTAQIAFFAAQGYLVIRQFRDQAWCQAVRNIVATGLKNETAPLEFESVLGYTGAPASLDAEGGRTVRRLRNVYHRDALLRDVAHDAQLVTALGQLLGEPPVLVLAHHNSIMTKHPRFGTATGWHRDIRYWSFAHNALISAWIALDEQRPDNGGLRVIPGSHLLEISRAQMDGLDFLRTDVAENQAIVAQGMDIHLQPGGLLLFHSGLFHAAGRNTTDTIKEALVYAYGGISNPPLPGSKSAAAPVIEL